MLRKLRKKRKGQSTAEYAILIALVVAAVIAMQTFTKRLLQAKIRDAADYMVTQTGGNSEMLGNTIQYEPYYLSTNFQTNRDSTQTVTHTNAVLGGVGYGSTSNITRIGDQTLEYDETGSVGNGMQ